MQILFIQSLFSLEFSALGLSPKLFPFVKMEVCSSFRVRVEDPSFKNHDYAPEETAGQRNIAQLRFFFF